MFALALCGALGVAFILFLLAFDLRAYLVSQTGSGAPVPSTGPSIAFAWAMALFWGFAWPWILIAVHRRPLRRLIEMIISEVDGDAVRYSRQSGR